MQDAIGPADVINSPDLLLDQRVGGLALTRFIDGDQLADEPSVWFEGVEDCGEKRLVYVYRTAEGRDAARTSIHGFRTTVSAPVTIGTTPLQIHAIIGEYRTMMDRELRSALTSPSTMPETIHQYEVQQVLGHGHKGVTYRVVRKRGTRAPYALKLTVAEEYEGGSYLPEVDRMTDLATQDRDHFPQIHECGEYTYTGTEGERKLVYFVEDFILGETLDKLVAHGPELVTPLFLEVFTREMLAALAVLERFGLVHDDLHARNVMLHESPSGYRPYLIDFGSTKRKEDSAKERDDLRNLAGHIAQVVNIINTRPVAHSAYEERVMVALEGLFAAMSDDDPMRRPESAAKILRTFDDYFPKGTFKQTLKHPFDFGNAEEVMDNELLHKLAAKSFPWQEKLESSANLLVIGPRGCGKTTVFRSMSFRCLADAGKLDDALSRPYLGLYISCNKEFRLRFSALPHEVLSRRHEEIRHYFNLIVLREFTGVLLACENGGHIGKAEKGGFAGFLADHECTFTQEPPHALLLPDLEAAVIRAIHDVRMTIWNNRDCSPRTTQGFISDLSQFVSQQVPALQGKTVYLLVDDYTERKVPVEAQSALNHVLFVPNGVYRAKISSEVFGVPPDETFGNFLDQDRDYKEWNLGTLYYATLPPPEQKNFLREIVDTRLELCEYRGRVADVIGPSQYPHGTLAREFKMEADRRAEDRRQRQDKATAAATGGEVESEEDSEHTPSYHGWDTICDLCTGDVSNILEILDRMYDECRITAQITSKIQPAVQDQVIQHYSRQYISKIKGIPQYGERLFGLVEAFGTMSARLLREYPWLDRDPERRDPYQLLRIEVDEGMVRSANESLASAFDPSEEPGGNRPDVASALWMLLQRHCLFIDEEESRSRRNTLASKAILRRVFCPAFRTTLSNSESYTLSKEQWRAFCKDPKGAAERYVRDVVARAKRRRGIPEDDFPLWQQGGGS